MNYTKSHEDWIIANLERILSGQHNFSERGIQLFLQRFHQIKEQRAMAQTKQIFQGTKE
jgi:hypothetical protein